MTGTVTIWLVLLALFALGTAETFADSSTSTFVPNLVAREDLGIANARLGTAFLLTNQLLVPPVGAFLFALGPALPFTTNAVCFALGALLISRVVDRQPVRAPAALRACAADLVEGVRWLLAHAPMRTLRSRSSRSTSRSGRRGRCSCSTPTSGSG